MYHDSLESKGETKEANKLRAEFTNTEYFTEILIHTGITATAFYCNYAEVFNDYFSSGLGFQSWYLVEFGPPEQVLELMVPAYAKIADSH